MKFYSLLTATLLAVAGVGMRFEARAQAENRVADMATHAWYQYFGDHRFTDHWGLHTEAQLRRASLLSDKQQLLLRAGINYTVNDQVMLTAGYGYVETYPYGEYPGRAAFPEHRIYEQVQLTPAPLGRLGLSHRYRLEQRFIEFPGLKEFQLLHRARYQVRATLPLTGPKVAPRTLYAFGYDEVFVGFGRHVASNIFDQNRLSAGLGYKITPIFAVEAGYLNQLVAHRDGRVFEYNHTLTLGVVGNLDLRRAAPAP